MIYAMFGMIVLTVVIGVIALNVRLKSVLGGSVKIKYFRIMEGQEVPEFITRSTRCLNNMFEVPVLFYVVATLFVSLKLESTLALILAWTFVGFRVLHAVVHLTYNNVLHRMLLFLGCVITVLLMWVVLLASLA